MRVGIALAAYQPQIDYFAEQLESIRSQTHTDWICLITLDPGTDAAHPGATLSALRNANTLQPCFEDRRFIWIENSERLGHKKNFEKAIQLALKQPGVQGIACSDQDDVWYPQKLARSVQALQKAGPLALVHCDMHFLTRDGSKLPETVWAIEHRGIGNAQCQHLLVRNIVAGCAMLFDAELARRFPIIPEGADFHDYWYAIVASLHGGIYAINEPLYAYRQHGGNVVGVTPFPGTFAMTPSAREMGLIPKCKATWNKSQKLALATIGQGLPLKLWHRIAFISRWDFGLLFLGMGIRHLFGDRPLARACFARAIGKAAAA
jgi:hypothetical protein